MSGRAPRRSVGTAAASAATPAGSTPLDTPGGSPPPDQSLIDQLNYAEVPRPFKNPAYGKTTSSRRPKTAKQIIQMERERYVKPKKRGRTIGVAATTANAATANTTAATTPVDGMDVDEENAAAQAAQTQAQAEEPEIVRKERYIAYHEYEAPPSLRPSKKYCDVTGLEAPYTDPKSRLRYHNADIYELLKTFSSGAEQEYLSLRGQGSMIR